MTLQQSFLTKPTSLETQIFWVRNIFSTKHPFAIIRKPSQWRIYQTLLYIMRQKTTSAFRRQKSTHLMAHTPWRSDLRFKCLMTTLRQLSLLGIRNTLSISSWSTLVRQAHWTISRLRTWKDQSNKSLPLKLFKIQLIQSVATMATKMGTPIAGFENLR